MQEGGAGLPGPGSSPFGRTETVVRADLIELGIPFTDPIADGPTIQKANTVNPRAGLGGSFSRLAYGYHRLRSRMEFPFDRVSLCLRKLDRRASLCLFSLWATTIQCFGMESKNSSETARRRVPTASLFATSLPRKPSSSEDFALLKGDPPPPSSTRSLV